MYRNKMIIQNVLGVYIVATTTGILIGVELQQNSMN